MKTQSDGTRPNNNPVALMDSGIFVQIARKKKEARKAREQLFDVDEDEEEEEEEGGGGRGTDNRGSSGKGGGRGGGGAESDSEDEDKGAGVWADNETEAMLGPGDEAKVIDVME